MVENLKLNVKLGYAKLYFQPNQPLKLLSHFPKATSCVGWVGLG